MERMQNVVKTWYGIHSELLEHHQCCRLRVRSNIGNLQALRFLSRCLRWVSGAEDQVSEQFSKLGIYKN